MCLYTHIEVVVAVLVVNMFTCLNIASYGVRVMTREFDKILPYASSTFLHLPGPYIQAIDPSLFTHKISGNKLKRLTTISI